MATLAEARKSLEQQGKAVTARSVREEQERLGQATANFALPETSADTTKLADGMTAADYARRQAFNEIAIREQRGLLDGQAAIAERQRIDQMFPSSQQAITNQQQGLDPTGQTFGQPGVSRVLATQQVAPTAGVQNGSQPTTGTTASVDNLAAAFGVIDDSDLPADVKNLFKEAVRGWDPDTEINTANVIKEFERISLETIDPYFQELSRTVIDEVTRAREDQLANQRITGESQRISEAEAIRGSQEDLASRGMLFGGEAVRQLGAKAPFATEGTPEAATSAIPTFGGQPIEGLVNTQNRLMSSSLQLRNKQAMESLQRQAEQRLGTEGAAGLVPEVSPLTGVVGSLQREKKQVQGARLTQLADQERQNVQARTPIKFNYT